MELKTVPINQIKPNPFQPRESFDKEALKELADSIRDAGVIQPIIVRPHRDGYQIVAGERRWRALQIADFKEIPVIIKNVDEERVLLESLIENLHRLDLTDIEREKAIHEIWASGRFKSRAELARTLGVSEGRVNDDIEAWEFRHKEAHGLPLVSTRTIRGTQGLPTEERKRIIEKVSAGELKVSEVDTVAKIIRKAPDALKKELLKPKSAVTPRIAEAIVEKLSDANEQEEIIRNVRRFRLTEDEVEDRISSIVHAKKIGVSLTKEMGVHEGTIYTVGDYECPHCKKHYLIKCNGKKDWLE